MLSQLCIFACLAGVMALPKIEHRAESAENGNDWSKYYEKFQDYIKSNQAVNKPESPISQGQIQSDSQYGMPDYQSQLSQYQQNFGNQQQYSDYFKKCMSSYNIQMPTQGEAGAASSPSYNQQQWNDAMKACSQNFQAIPGANSFGNGFPNLPGGNSASG